MLHVFASLLIGVLLLQSPALDSQSPKERQAAIDQMAVLGNRDAIPALSAAYKKEPRSDLRAEIVAAFGRIRDKSAIAPLSEALRSDLDKNVRLQSIDSLLRLYIQIDETGGIRTIFNKVKSVFSQPDHPVINPGVQVDAETTAVLSEAMQKDFSDDVRIEAARALGSLRATDQVPALIDTLKDPRNREHDEVRLEIIRSLGVIRDPSAGPALEQALRDRDNDIVGEAVTSLGLVGYKDSRRVVEELFRTSSDRSVKRRSLEALALMRDQETVPLFESLLGSTDDYYREVSAEGLARVHYDASGLKDRLTQEKKPNVRNALCFALASSGQNEYINDLANALDSRQDYQVEVYLYELGKFDMKLPELYKYLHSTNSKVRAKMVKVIGNIGDPSSREQIQPLTDDPNVDVVREALAALRKLSGSN